MCYWYKKAIEFLCLEVFLPLCCTVRFFIGCVFRCLLLVPVVTSNELFHVKITSVWCCLRAIFVCFVGYVVH